MTEQEALHLLDIIQDEVKADAELRQLGNGEYVVLIDKRWYVWAEADWHDVVKPQLPAKKRKHVDVL